MGSQKERSGTPVETRGAAQQGGKASESFLNFLNTGQGNDPRAGILGFNPANVGFEDIIRQVLTSPSAATSDLFSSLQPIENTELARSDAALKEMFSATGNRLSTSLGRVAGQNRADIMQKFGAQRQNALLQARSQQMQALMSLLGLTQSAANPLFGLATPGAPVFEPSTGQQIAAAGIGLAGAAAPFFLPGAGGK